MKVIKILIILFILLPCTANAQVEILFQNEYCDKYKEHIKQIFFTNDGILTVGMEQDIDIPDMDSLVQLNIVFRKLDYNGITIWRKNYLHEERITDQKGGGLGVTWRYVSSTRYGNRIIVFTKGNNIDRKVCDDEGKEGSLRIYKFTLEGDLVDVEVKCFTSNMIYKTVKEFNNKVLLIGYSYNGDYYYPFIFTYNMENGEIEEKYFNNVSGKFFNVIQVENGYEFIGLKNIKKRGEYYGEDYSPKETNWILRTDYNFDVIQSNEFKFIREIEPFKFEKISDSEYYIFVTEGSYSYKSGYYKIKDYKLEYSFIDRNYHKLLNYFIEGDIVYLIRVKEGRHCNTIIIQAIKDGIKLWEYELPNNMTDDKNYIIKNNDEYYLIADKSLFCNDELKAKTVITKFRLK